MEATGKTMRRHWECFNCDGNKLTIRIGNTKIFLECDECKSAEWIKR